MREAFTNLLNSVLMFCLRIKKDVPGDLLEEGNWSGTDLKIVVKRSLKQKVGTLSFYIFLFLKVISKCVSILVIKVGRRGIALQ